MGITARRSERLQEIRSLYPDKIFTASFDVRDPVGPGYLHQLITALGGMDVFIYNAGMGQPSREFLPEAEIETTETNVLGCVRLTAAAFAYFIQKGSGQIALTTSVAALRGNSWAPAYSASKAFLRTYAEGLQIKAGRLQKKIVVTELRPGFVNTGKAGANRRFWVITPQKAAGGIFHAIEKQKRIAYIPRRWWLVAQLLKVVPFSLYRRLA